MNDAEIDVLFVDDEAWFVQGYRNYLERQFKLHFRDKAEEAVELIRSNASIRAAVVDLMMPTPDGVDPIHTIDGLETGFWLLGQVKEILVKRPLPVVILTNRKYAGVPPMLANLGLPKDLVVLCQKLETPAFRLPGVLQQLLRRHGL